jgi:hypothetical protein
MDHSIPFKTFLERESTEAQLAGCASGPAVTDVGLAF